MLPEISVEAERHGDPIVKFRPLLSADGPVWPGHPSLPGGKAKVCNLLGSYSHFRARFLKPDQQLFALNSLDNAALASVDPGLHAHFVTCYSLHWSRSQVELFAI